MDLGIVVTGYDNLTAPFNKMDESIKRVGVSSQETANRLKAIQVVIAGILFEKSIELTKKFIDMSAEVQNVDLRMASWAGGMKAAQSVMEEFNNKLGASGIKIDSLGNAFIKLRAAGLTIPDAEKTIESLVNGIAAIGGGDIEGKLQAASSAFQLFLSRGVVGSKELRSILLDTGLTQQDLFRAMGSNATKFADDLKHGLVGAQQFLVAFNRAAEEKFGGFVTLLGSTVGGALNKFKNDVALAFGEFGQNSGTNAQVTVFLQNLDTAVVKFIQDIKPEQIQKFVAALVNIAAVAYQAAVLLVNVASVILVIADSVSKFLAILPAAATEYGIIGYVLFGRVGAAVGVIIGTIKNSIIDVDIAFQTMKEHLAIFQYQKDDAAKAIAADNSLKNNGSSVGLGLTDTQSAAQGFVAKLMGTKEQIAKVIADNLAQARKQLGGGGISPLPGQPDRGDKISAGVDTLVGALNQGLGKDQLLQFQNAGDTFDATLQQIRNTSEGWNKQLQAAFDTYKQIKGLTKGDIQTAQEAISRLQGQIADHTQDALDREHALNALKERELYLTEKIAQINSQEETRQLNLKTSQTANAGAGILGGTSIGQITDQVAQQKSQYLAQYYKLESDITAARVKEKASTADQITDIEKTIGLYKEQQEAIMNASNALSVQASIQAKYWADRGSKLENDIGNGISGLIQGTMTWGDVGRKVFSDLIDMSVKYLIQLLEIKAISAIVGFASGGVVPGGVMPFAKGGIPGLVTPFADGGLTTGPTLFGLAGEAGTEAIMPLKRGADGKLGVAASGGGAAFHLHIHTIDQKTGAEFLMANIDTISSALHHRTNLNMRRR